LDACALIAFLSEENGEGYEAGIKTANEIMRPVPYFPIEIIRTITDDIYSEAARFKASYSMAFAGCFLCATAKSLRAAIVTKDSEIRAVEQAENLSVLWIR
jgi:predicted nucleic acid-binding protein